MQITVRYTTKLKWPSMFYGFDLVVKGSFKIKGMRRRRFETWPMRQLPEVEGSSRNSKEIATLKSIEKYLENGDLIKESVIQKIEQILEDEKEDLLKWSLISQIDEKTKRSKTREFTFELEEK